MPLLVMNSATTARLCLLKILGLPGTHAQLPREPGSQTFTEDTCRAHGAETCSCTRHPDDGSFHTDQLTTQLGLSPTTRLGQ